MPKALDRLQGFDEAQRRADKCHCAFIMLGHGAYTLLDWQDYPKAKEHLWCRDKKGYAIRRTETGKQIKLHRFILGLPAGIECDHRNQDKLDNRRLNLRPATPHQNRGNAKKRRGGVTSRFRGVSWDSGKRKYRAQGRAGSKSVFLGRYSTQEQAALAYNRWAKAHFGEFANLNDIGTSTINPGLKDDQHAKS